MDAEKTKFALDTGSEEIDLGNFVDDNDEQRCNETSNFSPSVCRGSFSSQRGKHRKEIMNNKSFESSTPANLHSTFDEDSSINIASPSIGTVSMQCKWILSNFVR